MVFCHTRGGGGGGGFEICNKKVFGARSKLKRHLAVHDRGGISWEKKSPSFKQEVALFASQNTLSKASAKYGVSVATIWQYVQKYTPGGRDFKEISSNNPNENQTFESYLNDNGLLDDSDFFEAVLNTRKAGKQEIDPETAKEFLENSKKRKLKPDKINNLLSDIPNDLKAESDCSDGEKKHKTKNSLDEDEDYRKKFSEFVDATVKSEVDSEADEYESESKIPNVNIEKPLTLKVGNVKYEIRKFKDEKDNFEELKEQEQEGMEPEQEYDGFDDKEDETKESKTEENDYVNPEKTNKRHANQEKKDYRSGHCDQCNIFFKNLSSHRANMHTNGNTKECCQFCGLYFSQLKEHQSRKHWKELEENTGTPATRFSCDICNSSIVWHTQRDLDRHVRKFHGNKLTEGSHICHCGLSFETFRILRVHQSYAHSVGMKPEKTEDGRYPCQQCDATFQYPNLLYEHTKRIHEHIRFPCSECDKTFSDSKGRDLHQLRLHTEPQLQCHECGNKYHLERELERHKKVHTKEIKGDLICELCDKEFKNFKSLWNHQSANCGTKYRQKYKKTGSTDSESFTCDTCGKGFRTTGALEKHINIIHNGEKSFSCDTCGKSFTRASNLFSHRKIHEGIKEFNCLYCNSAYGEKRNLINHVKRNHPGEEKYRRVTPQGEIIMDVKTSLYDLSLTNTV